MTLIANVNFIEQTNLLHFNIDLANIGVIDNVTTGKNIARNNRLFIIPKNSENNNSFIINHTSIKRHKLKLKPGHTYFIPADVMLEYHFDIGTNIYGYHFSLELFRGFDIYADHKICIEKKDNNEIIDFIIRHGGEQSDIGTMFSLRGALLFLSSSFCHQSYSELQKVKSAINEFNPLLDYIENNCTAQLTLKILATQCKMNVDQLRKRFERKTGIKLKTYLDQILIKKAIAKLIYTNSLIYEISNELMFSSEYYFSSFFKKYTGLSPLKYRKTHMSYLER
jgi:AraC-like DNA-binding protein